MHIRSHHCAVESLVSARQLQSFQPVYRPLCSAAPAALCSSGLPSGPAYSACCIQPVGSSFRLSHGPVLSCPWASARAFRRLRPPSSYTLLARAHCCSSSGPLLLPVSARACFSSLRWRWCPSSELPEPPGHPLTWHLPLATFAAASRLPLVSVLCEGRAPISVSPWRVLSPSSGPST